MAALIFLLACVGGEGLAACDGVSDPVSKEDCRYQVVKKLLDDRPAFTAAVDSITPDTSRDLLLYRIAFDEPKRAPELCRMVRTAATKEKCEKVLGRPHLAGPPKP